MQESYPKMKELKSKDLPESWKNVEDILHHQGLLYVLEVIYSITLSRSHDNLLAKHFKIDKINELVARNHFWSIFYRDVKVYIKDCNLYLASKAILHKPYRDFLLLQIPTYC